MKHRNNFRRKLLHRYLAWRKALPLGWRIVTDILSVVLGAYAVMYALMIALMILLPFMILMGLAKGSGGGQSDKQWYEDNDPRGQNGPHSQAPDYFH